MNRFSSIALSAALLVGGVGASVAAQAHPYVEEGVACPGGPMVERVGYARPFYGPRYFGQERFGHQEFARERFDRFHREHWDRR
jgi:hypothetical protein